MSDSVMALSSIKSIPSPLTVKVLTEKDFKKVYNALYEARVKWRPIGIELGLQLSDLDDIEKRFFTMWGNDRCLEETIRKWLKSRPNWEKLIAALKSAPVGEEGVACDIELVSAENCYLTGEGVRVARVGHETTATLHAIDVRHQACEITIEDISGQLVPCKGLSTVKCTVEKRERNQYEVRYTPATRGQHQLQIKVEEEHVEGSPFNVTVYLPIEELGTPVKIIDGLNHPFGAAVNRKGEIVVAEYKGNCVSIFSHRGERLRAFGTEGTAPGQFKSPTKVAIDKDGNIFVADLNNHRVQVFSPDGKFIKSVGTKGDGPLQFDGVGGVAISENGTIYVLDDNNYRVQVLNPDLTFHSSFGSKGSNDGQFWDPFDVQVDSKGNVYVADYGNGYVTVFTGNGQFLKKIGDGTLSYPTSVTTDVNGTVFVADRGHDRVSVFNSQGEFVRAFGTWGTDPGQFKYHYGVALDGNGFLYVCDSDNGRLQIF